MSAAVSALRRQLEELVPMPPVESRGIETGFPGLDELLPMRGLPRGKLSEIRGQKSSGITTVLRHIIAKVSQKQLVAYVDARRTLAAVDWVGIGIGESETTRARGKRARARSSSDPSQHLWIIRPHVPSDASWCADVLLRSGAFALVVLDGSPPLSRSTAARLIRLAREAGTALVVAGEAGDGGIVGAAVRMTVGKRERREVGSPASGTGHRRRIGDSGLGRGARTRSSRQAVRALHANSAAPDAQSAIPDPHLIITIEKGGIRRGVEVEYAIGLEDRLCAYPEVGDRRGAEWADGGSRENEGIGDWGLGIGPHSENSARRVEQAPPGGSMARGVSRERAQTPIPNPQPNPHWDSIPIALVSDVGRVRLASRAATRAGIRSGMMVTAARALCAALEVHPWDEVAIAQAVDAGTAALLAVASHVSPVPDAPGTWWVGASGYEALGGERRLADLLLAIARRWHPGARVAIAGSCVAAYAATWDGRGVGSLNGSVAESEKRETGNGKRETPRRETGNGTAGSVAIAGDEAARNRSPREREIGDATVSRFPFPAGRISACRNQLRNLLIVSPNADAEYLSVAPLALIPMDEEIREALWALGLRTAGALARLEPGEVERRWGEAGLTAWRLARGEDSRRPVLADPERPRTVSAELAVPADTMEPVLFLVRSALERLVPPLVADGRAAAAVAITLTLDLARTALPTGARAHTVTREVRLPRPVARVVPLLDHCRSLLERWLLEAPLCGVEVAIVATAPASGEQGDLLDATWRDPGAAEAALARIRSALGAGTVVRPEPGESHAPERTAVWVESSRAFQQRDSYSNQRETGNGKRETKRRETGIGNEASGIGKPDSGSRESGIGNRESEQREMGSGHRTARDQEGGRERHGGHGVPIPDFRFPLPATADSLPASLRLLESPESVEVECDGDTPCAVWWHGERLTIARALGPERLSGEWWSADPYARDYWRCGGEGGELLVYADARDGGWYVQGWYD